MIAPELFNRTNVQEAIQVLLLRNNCSKATTQECPKYKTGNFSWFDKILGRNIIVCKEIALIDYPTHWTYVTIKAKVYDNTAYLTYVDYHVAEC